MKIYLSVFLIGLFSLSLSAQHQCGLPGGEEDRILIERLKANKRLVSSAAYQRSAVTRYVPIVIHDVQKSDGSGAVAVSRIFDQMCSLNAFYEEQGTDIQFFLKEINIIKNNTVYTTHESSTGGSIMNNNRDSKAMNIFIPEDANTGGTSLGITLGYYSPFRDWIVMRPGEINGFSNTLWHEVGHYLTLPHPFRGWDNEAYDPDVHGVQVGFSAPNGVPNEHQDGGNCNTAGDLLCDTPPDYNHFDTNWGCNYFGGAKDPNGDLIDPDETNIMSYFGSCEETSFSPDQIEVMNADINTRVASNEIILGVGPMSAGLGGAPTLIEPINEEEVPNNANIYIDWEDVPNADGYLLEIDRFANFAVLTERFSVEDSEYFFDGSNLLDNTKHYWRVRAYNKYDHCSEWTDGEPFRTTVVSSVKTISEISEISIFPNPTSENLAVTVFVNSTEAFNGNLSIFNIAGQNIRSISNVDIQKGENNIEVSVADLPKGMYLVNLLGKSGLVQEKLLVN